MKVSLFKRLVKILFIPSCFVVFSANMCEIGGGGVPTPSVSCSSKYENSPKEDFPISKVNLRYDLSGYVSNSNYLVDMNDFAVAHGMDTFKGVGTISALDNILFFASNYDDDHKPSIEVTLSGTQCSGSIKKSLKSEEVMGNTLKNCPAVFYDLSSVSYTINSVKSSFRGVQLKWEGTYQANGTGYTNVVFDSNATVKIDTKAIITTLGVNKKQLAMRDNCAGVILTKSVSDFARIVENTVPKDATIECVRKSSGEVFVSPALKRNVYIGGRLDDNYVWDTPELYDIIK